MGEQVKRFNNEAKKDSTTGFRNQLRMIWDVLDLEERDAKLSKLVRRLLKLKDRQKQLDGLAEVENLVSVLAKQDIEQIEIDHRHFVLGQSRPGATDRQIKVLQDECQRLEGRLAKLEKLLTPYNEQLELLNRQYQKKLDDLADAKLAMPQSNNRRKGATVSRLIARVFVFPLPKEKKSKEKRKERRLHVFLFWDELNPQNQFGRDVYAWFDSSSGEFKIKTFPVVFTEGSDVVNYGEKRSPSGCISLTTQGSPWLW